MHAVGKIVTVSSSGTPVTVESDSTVRVHKLIIAGLVANTGTIYVGGVGMVVSTMVNVVAELRKPFAAAAKEEFEICDPDGNSIAPSSFMLDAATSGDKALVTYVYE